MDPFNQAGSSTGQESSGEGTPPSEAAGGGAWVEGMAAPGAYNFCDRLTELLLYGMVIFTPWAFGTTQDWAILVMNWTGYLLGGCLLAKRWLRWRTGYRPPRWGEETPARGQPARFRPHTRLARWLTRWMASGTVLFLGYCLVSALNARATFQDGIQHFNDQYLAWLPHSYDAARSWTVLGTYLGLACFFWATRDWLLGKGPRERGESTEEYPPVVSPGTRPLPDRLTRLFWVLCLNAALLGIVSVLQRLDGTEKLLWLLQPRYGTPDFHFGPFSYRGNGAQYFNLVWPVSLAFWWTLFRASQVSRRADARIGSDPHLLLLPCVLIQGACAVISASHGGAVVAAGLALVALGILLAASWRSSLGVRLAMLLPFALGLALALYLGWNQFQAGFTNAFLDDLGDRVEISENARQMAVDHPAFGTGPGTFSAMYRLYRTSDKHDWAAFAHNDWLETIITFGWIGFTLILLLLLPTLLRWWIPDGIPCGGDLVAMLWLAMAGCLFHARFDFPFQVYSLLFLFLLFACVTCCLARRQ